MNASLPLMSNKERFLSTAVHDLKNPLHSIVLFIAALKQSEDPERINYLIERLDRSTRGLDALFKRLLDLSRLDLGESLPENSVFDAHAHRCRDESARHAARDAAGLDDAEGAQPREAGQGV